MLEVLEMKGRDITRARALGHEYEVGVLYNLETNSGKQFNIPLVEIYGHHGYFENKENRLQLNMLTLNMLKLK